MLTLAVSRASGQAGEEVLPKGCGTRTALTQGLPASSPAPRSSLREQVPAIECNHALRFGLALSPNGGLIFKRDVH